MEGHHLALAANHRKYLEDFRFSAISEGFEDLVGYSKKELRNKDAEIE